MTEDRPRSTPVSGQSSPWSELGVEGVFETGCGRSPVSGESKSGRLYRGT